MSATKQSKLPWALATLLALGTIGATGWGLTAGDDGATLSEVGADTPEQAAEQAWQAFLDDRADDLADRCGATSTASGYDVDTASRSVGSWRASDRLGASSGSIARYDHLTRCVDSYISVFEEVVYGPDTAVRGVPAADLDDQPDNTLTANELASLTVADVAVIDCPGFNDPDGRSSDAFGADSAQRVLVALDDGSIFQAAVHTVSYDDRWFAVETRSLDLVDLPEDPSVEDYREGVEDLADRC